MEKNTDNLAKLIAEDMGKPITQAKIEPGKAAFHCKYFADNLEKLLTNTPLFVPPARAYIIYEPIGPLYLIMPWNFPVWLPLKAAIPSLALGNTIILKPAPNVARSTLKLLELIIEAGFKNGEFQVLFANEESTEEILKDSRIAGVSLTGSVKTGQIIGKLAGENLKRLCLELGGSDPFLVLENADLAKASKMAAQGRLLNAGQVCVASKRFIIHEKVYDDFVQNLIKEVAAFKMGNPLDPSVSLGPLARKDILDTLKEQLKLTIRMGAKVIYGDKKQISEPKSLNGNFFNPVILDSIPLNSPAAREEIFGPAFTLFKVKSDEEAVNLANDTQFGLGSSVWSKDISKATKVAEKIQAGMVFVNDMVRVDSRLPFGGHKKSGFGKECWDTGFKQFALEKTMIIN